MMMHGLTNFKCPSIFIKINNCTEQIVRPPTMYEPMATSTVPARQYSYIRQVGNTDCGVSATN
jgi:hypothetical protein